MSAWWWLLAAAAGWFPLGLLTLMLWQTGRPPLLAVWPAPDQLQMTMNGVPRRLLLVNALMLQLPLLALGLGVGGVLVAHGQPAGLVILEAFGLPGLLRLLATARTLLRARSQRHAGDAASG